MPNKSEPVIFDIENHIIDTIIGMVIHFMPTYSSIKLLFFLIVHKNGNIRPGIKTDPSA